MEIIFLNFFSLLISTTVFPIAGWITTPSIMQLCQIKNVTNSIYISFKNVKASTLASLLISNITISQSPELRAPSFCQVPAPICSHPSIFPILPTSFGIFLECLQNSPCPLQFSSPHHLTQVISQTLAPFPCTLPISSQPGRVLLKKNKTMYIMLRHITFKPLDNLPLHEFPTENFDILKDHRCQGQTDRVAKHRASVIASQNEKEDISHENERSIKLHQIS